jgi:hypothetical protein
MEPTKRCPHCAEEILAAAIKCKHCQSGLGPPTGKNPAPSTPKPAFTNRRSFKVSQIIGGIILAVWFIARTHTSEQSGSGVAATEATPATVMPLPIPELKAAVSNNGLILRVINNDTFNWEDCHIDVNPHGFSHGYQLKLTSVARGSTDFETTDFATSDGERFDSMTRKIQEVDIVCHLPSGTASWGGNFGGST